LVAKPRARGARSHRPDSASERADDEHAGRARDIEQRQANLPQYIKTFKVLLQTLLSDNVEITFLRTALHGFKEKVGDATGSCSSPTRPTSCSAAPPRT
jgi:hypothetical protein